MLITDISKQVGKNGTKINISYLKDRDGIVDKYTLTSVELPRPEMLDIWSAINIAFQVVGLYGILQYCYGLAGTSTEHGTDGSCR